MQTYSFRTSEKNRPLAKKITRAVTIATIAAYLCNSMSITLFGHSILSIFLVSPLCINHSFYWQPITAFFILPDISVSLSSFIDIFFGVTTLSFFTTSLIHRMEKKRFWIFLVGLAYSAAIPTAVAALDTGGSYSTFYPTVAGFGLAWVMCCPSSSPLFLLLRISKKALLIATLIIPIVSSLISLAYIDLISYAIAYLYAYLHILCITEARSDFDFLFTFETVVKRTYLIVSRFIEWNILGKLRKRKETTTSIRDSDLS